MVITKYFISYRYQDGYGNCEAEREGEKGITSIEDIREIENYLEETGNKEGITIMNYIKLE